MTPTRELVRFTKVTDDSGVVTKSVSLGPDGKVVKAGGGKVCSGTFSVVDVAWAEFGQFLMGLGHDSCIMPGVAIGGRREGTIKTKAFIADNPDCGALVRGKDGFVWGDGAKALVLDFDKIPAGRDAESVITDFLEIAPVFKHLDFWLLPSSSSHLWKVGAGEAEAELSGLRGLHAYFRIDAGIDPDLVKEYISVQLSLHAGGVYFTLQDGFVSGEGRIPVVVKRTSVDLAMFQPFRLLFSSGMKCGAGLSQRRGSAVWFPAADAAGTVGADFAVSREAKAAALVCERGLKDAFMKEVGFGALKSAEIEIASKRDGVSAGLVKANWEATERGLVVGSSTVLLDSGEWVKAWRLKLFAEEFDRKTCHDPLEPDYGGKGAGGANKAIIYSSSMMNKCSIVSQAHGGRVFRVVLDQQSVVEVLAMFSSVDEIEEVLGSEWLRLLMFDEGIDDRARERLLGKVQEKFNIQFATRTEVKDLLVATMGEGVEKGSDSVEALASLNTRFATAEIGKAGAFRVLYRGSAGWHMQKKDDFLLSNNVSGGVVTVWAAGARKKVPAATYWLKAWPGRKHYNKVFFDPAQAPGEVVDALNLWEGFTVEGVAGRGCGRERGCIECFVTSGFNLNCCSAGNSYHTQAQASSSADAADIVYWLRHIYECVCREKSEDFIWVLDWLCDIVQRPGGKRPGTALVVHGEQKGTGKEVVIAPILALLGGAGLMTSKMDNISGKFNAVMESKVLVFADEATWGRGHEVKSALKSLVTGPTLVVEPKGIDAYSVRNFVRLYAASNNEQAYPAEEGERRAAIFNISEHRKGQLEEWFYKFVDQDLGVLLDELLHWKIESNLKLIPNTDSLRVHKEIHMAKKIDWVFWEYLTDQREAGDDLIWDSAGVGQKICYEILEKYFVDGGFSNFRHEGYSTLTWNEFKVRLRLFFERNDLVGSKAEGAQMNSVTRKKARHFILKPVSECMLLLKKLVE